MLGRAKGLDRVVVALVDLVGREEGRDRDREE